MIQIWWQRIGSQNFCRYVYVGLLNTVVCYVVFVVLIAVGFHYLLASPLSYVAGVGNSYVWNKYFTFRTQGGTRAEFVKFVSVYAGQYSIGLVGLVILVEFFDLGPAIAQGILLFTMILFSFFAHQHWTFAPRHDDSKYGGR